MRDSKMSVEDQVRFMMTAWWAYSKRFDKDKIYEIIEEDVLTMEAVELMVATRAEIKKQEERVLSQEEVDRVVSRWLVIEKTRRLKKFFEEHRRHQEIMQAVAEGRRRVERDEATEHKRVIEDIIQKWAVDEAYREQQEKKERIYW